MWTVSFRQDTEAKGVGTLTAMFDDGTVTATHSARVDTNSDFGGFVAGCEAVLSKTRDQRTEMQAVAAKIEAVLNGGK
jgi:hypothetical protein